MPKRILNVDAAQFKQVIEDSDSYSEAAAKLGVHIKTICAWASKLGVRKTTKGSGGARKRCTLHDILNGLHPQYPTYKLKLRLLKEGLLTYKCVECNISQYNSKPITLELDHFDGNNCNHSLSNLRLLCPNCHSQTDTYKSKNKKLKRFCRISSIKE